MSSNNTKGGGGGGGKGGANEWSQAQSASQWCVGCQVTLTTTMNEVVKGEVFAYDGSSKCLVLREPLGSKGATTSGDGNAKENVSGDANEAYNIRVINANYIKKVISAEQPASKDQNNGALPHVCIKRAEQREAKALQEAKQRAAQIGVGVTREAQRIFDGVNKTLPCKLKGKDI